MSDVMAVTPGVQMDIRPAMGRGAEAGSGGGKVFGVTGQVNPLVEGISTRQDANSTVCDRIASFGSGLQTPICPDPPYQPHLPYRSYPTRRICPISGPAAL
jgi:hypothetical protein